MTMHDTAAISTTKLPYTKAIETITYDYGIVTWWRGIIGTLFTEFDDSKHEGAVITTLIKEKN